MAQIGIRAQMWAVTNLDDETIKKAQLKPYSDVQTAIDDAEEFIKSNGNQPKTVLMPAGSLTVPYVKK
jgi:hypothetical protein